MNKKNILLIIIIILFILIILLFTLLNNIKEQKSFGKRETIFEDEGIVDTVKTNKFKLENNRNSYYIVSNCINKYYIYCSLINSDLREYYGKNIAEEELKEAQETNKTILYNLLDKEYITNNGITKENIDSKLPKIGTVLVNIEKMYVNEISDDIKLYVVKGILLDKKTKDEIQINLLVKLDTQDRLFSIVLYNKNLNDINDKTYEEIVQELNINIKSKIEENKNNKYIYNNVLEESYIKDLFNNYKMNSIDNIQRAYEYIDEEYKEKRFSTLKEFQIYANSYVTVNTHLEQYKRISYPDYTQYICIDNNGNYYIFRETAVMDYTVILDNHTIDLPEFTTKYNSATAENKVAMNLEKVRDALNTKDYQFIYNKLDNTFKQNNYPSLAYLENFINTNLFDTNKFSYEKVQEDGGLYVAKVAVTDNSGKDTRKVNLTVIMQLKEGTDFVMSFSVE